MVLFANSYWQFNKMFTKVITSLTFIIKNTIINLNIDNSYKCMNEYKVNMKKKKLSNGTKNYNGNRFFFLM